MSLIQEALKRQQQENEGIAPTPPTENTTPPKPFPFPISIDEGNINSPLAADSSPKPPAQKRPPVRITTAVPAAVANAASTQTQQPAPAQATVTPPTTKVATTPPPSQEQTVTHNNPPKDVNRKTSTPKTKKEEKSKIGAMLLTVVLLAIIFGGVIYIQFSGIAMPWSHPTEAEKQAALNQHHPPVQPQTLAKNGIETAKETDITDKMVTNEKTENQINDKDSGIQTQKNQEVNKVASSDNKQSTEPTESQNLKVAGTAMPQTPTKIASAHSPSPVVVDKPNPTPIVQANTPKEKEPIIWPDAKLKGIVGSGSEGAVMINKSIIGVGDDFDGVKVTRIVQDGVWLEYKGETRFLKVGKSL